MTRSAPRRPSPKVSLPILAFVAAIAVIATAIFVLDEHVESVQVPGGMVVHFSEGSADKAQGQLKTTQSTLVAAAKASGATAASDTADFAGTWQGDNGAQYRIQQFGAQAVIQESFPAYGITGVGSGEIRASAANLHYQAADGSVGDAVLNMTGT